MKKCLSQICFVIALFTPALASANLQWHWSFDQSNFYLPTQSPLTATVFNDSLSSDSIDVLGVSLLDISSNGMLQEPGKGTVVMSIASFPPTQLLPGQSASIPLIYFYISPSDQQISGTQYTIAPYLYIAYGTNCSSGVGPTCGSYDHLLPDSPVTIAVATVPEPGIWLSMVAGLLLFLGISSRRQSKPASA